MKAEVVICGAGIAGISAAYHLAARQGIKGVVLVDERPPLTLTSDKSTECYRNMWPGPGNSMVSLMNRSIDILEEIARESGNLFHLNRRGYLYATALPGRIPHFRRAAEEAAGLGAGPLRCHDGQSTNPGYIPAPAEGFEDLPGGIDLILDQKMIRDLFPYLSGETVALVHARRCGWFSVQQLGMYLLEEARKHGVQFLSAGVEGVKVGQGRVQAVAARSEGGEILISTPAFVNAAGPLLKNVGRMVGVDLPVFSELHMKMSFKDHLRLVPRNAPLLIWTDPVSLPWSKEERALLSESEETRRFLEEMPSGVHTRPEGGPASDVVIGLWAYHTPPVEPAFPISSDSRYPEMVLRGLTTMIPCLQAYIDHLPKAVVDGGYYTKTRENRPLIGSLPVRGGYVMGGLSGFGVMAACGAGELLAAHVTGSRLPAYAPAFALERYENPEYQKLLETFGDSGQL